MIKIAIAEDNSFLANSLINKLGLFDEFKVKFHVLNGELLISKLDSDSNIDIILMDIQMPTMDGIQATKIIAQKYPQIKIIMLTVLDSEQAIYESVKNGAVGYLVKESKPEEIKFSIEQAINGHASMSPSITLKAMKIMQNPDSISEEKKDFNLSRRETEVLSQLCKGLNYNEIANNLFISPNTVRRHIENTYKKLEVSNKAQAVQTAFENRLV
ncbi:MAG: response regulator [Crocinitomicaceae bacterium]